MLEVREISPLHRLPVARLMAHVHPEKWDVHEALELLNTCHGWFLENQQGACFAWLAARQHPDYRSVEIESMGYANGNTAKIGPEIIPLIDACEDWALKHGMVNSRFVTHSRGLSCHDKEIILPGEELIRLQGHDRPDFDWLVLQGYQPCGILPEIFGYHYHGILLIKQLKPLDIGSLLQSMS